MRKIGAIAAGIVLGIVLIQIAQLLGHAFFETQTPSTQDPKAWETFVAGLPLGAKLIIPFGYALGAFGGGWLSTLLDRKASSKPAWITSVVLMGLGIFNLLVIPHPIWLAILAAAVFIPFGLLGFSIVKSKKTAL